MVGRPGRMLHAVLRHLKGGNDPPMMYPAAPVRSGGQWMLMRTASSSSSSSRSSSSGLPALFSVKAEPAETPLGRRTRTAGIVINEGGRASSSTPPHFVKPKTEPAAVKTEPGLASVKTQLGLASVKTQPELAAVKTESVLFEAAALKWAREDWAWMELERQCRAFEQFTSRRCGRD